MRSRSKSGSQNLARRPWYLYIVRCRDGTLYTGITLDVTRRVADHDAGRAARYTRGRGPVILVHVEVLASRGDALRREAAVKRLSARAKRSILSARRTLVSS
ncbi:MAG: GIY-YIG nuclease family protein [Deltaproteobacteria bacterium]|nr:GIY-YIG nuclease family protein [Deltaproteobacteria bacterium]